MTAPQLYACYFRGDYQDRWERLARVLRLTAAEHCPDWRVQVESIAPVAIHHRLGSRTVVRNTQKLERWADVVAAAENGDRLLLMDADTFLVRSLDAVWDLNFDVAITTKRAEYPINGGVVFLRISEAVKRFMEAWRSINSRMLHDPGFHQSWKRKYAGMNQAALGYLLEAERPSGVQLLELPCSEWNCEDSAWATFDPSVTRIVHVKSELRIACLDTQPIPPALSGLAARWRALDRQAQGVAA